MPAQYKPFFARHIDERHSTFGREPLDAQYWICYYGYACFEPPDTYFYDLASNGDAVIPLLLAKLKGNPDDLTREVVFQVFGDMARDFVDLRNREDVQSALRESLSTTRSGFTRQLCASELRVVETHNGRPSTG